MKLVQNNAYWKELLLNSPGQFIILKVLPSDESTEVVYISNELASTLEFNQEQFILASLENEFIKRSIDQISDLIAQHSNNAIEDEKLITTLFSKTGHELSIPFQYSIKKLKSSQLIHLIVSFNSIDTARTEKSMGTEINYTSDIMKTLLSRIPDLIKLNHSIVIQGESGTGKTTLLNFIRDSVWLNELTVLEWGNASLSDDETQLARNTVLLIDELEKLSIDEQKKINALLKANQSLSIIGTSAKNLELLIDKSEFDPEFYYQMSAHTLHIPPLKFRKSDVFYLLDSKKRELTQFLDSEITFSEEVKQFLEETDWDMNYKSVNQFVQSWLSNIINNEIHLDPILKPTDGSQSFLFKDEISDIEPFDEMVKKYLRKVLSITSGRIYGSAGAAKLLKMKPTTLQSKLKKLGIK